MDLVIKRLSSIEEASAGIIEAAENEKKALEQQMRERIQALEAILDAEHPNWRER